MRYASTEPDVLRGAELQLYKKEHLCLLGGNGAGKTTLLSCLIGTAKPQRWESGTPEKLPPCDAPAAAAGAFHAGRRAV